ncbi:MAG: PDZ domain-containing protein [Planctomycetes bacterium]|nr:PDZ domain-containing protein [Planctomycetota bacterium]
MRPVLVMAMVAAVLVGAAGAAERSPSEFAAEAKALADLYEKQFGEGYTTHIDSRWHLVYVSALDDRTLRNVTHLLALYAEAQQRSLFREPLLWNVTVVLPTVNDYRKSSPPREVAGYYNPATRTLTSLTTSDVLIHEFTHALHHSDEVRANQRHPVWLREGLATLFQGSRVVEGGRLEVLPDPSLAMLQGAIRDRGIPPLADLLVMDHRAFTEKAEICYPYVRHIMLYLHQQEKLGTFYEAYKAQYTADVTARKALEATLGQPLEAIEKAWRAWLLAREPPWTPAHPTVAHLGIRMRRAPEGIMVDAFLPGSTAQRAGVLKINDIIVSVAGRATPNARDLAPAVQSCKPGQTIDIEIIRDGQRMVVQHVLGAIRE